MKTALVTIAVGEQFQQVHALTKPRMVEYAKMIGAEYVTVDSSKHQIPHFAKFEMFAMAADRAYDKVLYVDADIYIKQTAPDIFDQYDSAAFSELPHPEPGLVTKSTQWIRRMLDADWPADRYFNTGVLVIGGDELQMLAAIVRNAAPMPGIYFEQDQLNVFMRDVGFPRQQLGQRWNQFCGPSWLTHENASDAYFLHGTGVGVSQKHRFLSAFADKYP